MAVFAAVLVGGGKVMGVWDRPPAVESTKEALQVPLLPPAETTTEEPEPAAPPPSGSFDECLHTVKNDPGESESTVVLASFNPRDPQEQRNAGDDKLARRAVVRRGDLGDCWERMALSDWNGPVRCASHDPDLSSFVVTGRASSSLVGGNGGVISSVTVFADTGQAREYFRLTATRSVLACLRARVQGFLDARDTSPRLKSATMATEPMIGSQTAVYRLRFAIVTRLRGRLTYPAETIVFQQGRAIGAVSFVAVGAFRREVHVAQLVASRLSGS
jgi:hypothetical protein